MIEMQAELEERSEEYASDISQTAKRIHPKANGLITLCFLNEIETFLVDSKILELNGVTLAKLTEAMEDLSMSTGLGWLLDMST